MIQLGIFSSVIVKDDYIIDEYYKDGYDETSNFILNSASKSITSSLIGIAIDKRYIENVNVPISEYFPEIQNSNSDFAKQITIWHLLTHTSGIAISDTENWDEWRNSENWVQYILDAPVTSKPGTVFNYSTTNTHLLCAILQKATGMTAYEFGKIHLFDPIGMKSVQCETDAQGISDGGNGFIMNIYDMLKFGQLYLKGGVWEGQQIISNQWINDSTTLQFKRSSGSANYGYQWWVRTFGNQNYAAYFAQGHAGQYIFVIPDLELVIAFTSNHTGSSSMYWQFVNKIVSAYQEQNKALATINIIAGNQTVQAELYNNPTSKSFIELLPLTVPVWHPAEIAKAFNLPYTIDNSLPTTREYKSGELAYWHEGPSIAMFYNHNFEQTVVPVITMGRILDGKENIFETYMGNITITLKED